MTFDPNAAVVAPDSQDSQNPAGVVEEAVNVAQNKQAVEGAPTEDSTEKLAEAEKRLKDTQRWAHEQAQKAAKLQSELTRVYSNPAIQRVIEAAQKAAENTTPNADAETSELRQAWAEYQGAPDDETAFRKLLEFAEKRSTSKAVKTVGDALARRELEASVQRQNIQAAQVINNTVSEAAPDVPIELFWAMSGRAEQETPPEITEPAARISWQVNKAIELARAALTPIITRARGGPAASAPSIMPGGNESLRFGTIQTAPSEQSTMVSQVKARQQAMYRGQSAR